MVGKLRSMGEKVKKKDPVTGGDLPQNVEMELWKRFTSGRNRFRGDLGGVK